MKRSTKIIVVLITAGITYGSLMATIGPPKHERWGPGYHFHKYHHHHYHDSTNQGSADHQGVIDKQGR